MRNGLRHACVCKRVASESQQVLKTSVLTVLIMLDDKTYRHYIENNLVIKGLMQLEYIYSKECRVITHTHTHIHIHTHVYIYIYTHTHTYIYICFCIVSYVTYCTILCMR